jgi:hypothetical protein
MRPYRYFPVEIEGELEEKILSLGLKVHDSVIFDPETGLKVIMYKKENQLLIAFGPASSHRTEIEDKTESEALGNKVYKDIVLEIAGSKPSLYKKADELIGILKDHARGKEITLTGQSLGGAIASYVALNQGLKCICLNSLPIGPGLQCDIGKTKLQNADKWITHLMTEGDIVCDLPLGLKVVDYALGLLGFKTAGNFGVKYRIPSIYKNMFETHVYMIGNLFAYWRPDKLQVSQELPHHFSAFSEALYKVQREEFSFLHVT